MRMSEAVFAAMPNVSARTVQSREQGVREPSDAALRMIQIVRVNPGIVRELFNGNCRSPKLLVAGAGNRRTSRRVAT